MIETTIEAATKPASFRHVMRDRRSLAGTSCAALIVGATLATGLWGCSLGEPRPTGRQFLLRAPDTDSAASATGTFEPLHVAGARVASPFNDQRFMYLLADGEFKPDPYNGFLAAPSDMVTNSAIDYLRSGGMFRAVCGAGLTCDARYRLQLVVEELVGDFSGGDARARMSVRFFLSDESVVPPRVLLDQTFVGETPLADGRPEVVAAGLNAAMLRVFALLEAELRATLSVQR